MDKKRGLKNVTVSIAFKVVLLVVSILVRRFLIKFAGNEVNGLNSLYLSIIGFLAVAELGVGSAITFCMYKPIVDGDNNKVSALYRLFTKLYLIIGAVIFVAGCILLPLLKYFAADYQEIDQNLYLTFFLMLVSVVLSYLFSSKTSLINAYKNNYITTTINSFGMLLQYGLQILVLFLTKSFVWYLVCRIVAVVVQWLITEIIARKRYGFIIKNKQKIDADTKSQVTKSVKAMFMHKIGGVLVNTADSVIISAFIGVVILGKYSNYTTVMVAMTGVITLFFTPLTSVIGHLCVEEDKSEVKKYLNFFHAFNFMIGVIFFLGYYAIIDNMVTICFGENLELSKSVSFIITLNYFIQFMRQATLLFRDATGTFYNDRWKPLFEGILNVGLSIGFVYLFSWLFGDDFAVVGVIVATIVTNLTICHIVEPHVLYKYALKSKTTKYYLRNYLYILAFALAMVALNFCLQTYESQWIELLVNGSIAVAIAVIPCTIAAVADKDFRFYFVNIAKKIKRKFVKDTNTENDEMVEMTLREIQLAELEILKEFDNICRENNLKYSLSCGTLLGAIRHKGFIPWDDDIDVEMPRPDYEKFIELVNGGQVALKDGYVLTPDRGREAKYPWIKIIDTSYETKSQILNDGYSGVFIDIFPVDGYSDNLNNSLKNHKKVQKFRRLLAYNYLTLNNFSSSKKFARRIYACYAKMHKPGKLVEKINKLSLSYPYAKATYAGVVYFKPAVIIGAFSKQEMESTVDVEFEGYGFKAYKCYDKYLKLLYDDYMKIPQGADRENHTLKCFKK